MPFCIEDDDTAALVATLAARMRVTKQDAVKAAVRAELEKLDEAPRLRRRLDAFYARFPLPELTGEKADKAFFDGLSGELD